MRTARLVGGWQKSSDAIRVVVADDQQLVREGLVALLGLIDGVEVAGAAANGVEAVEIVARGNVDVELMDLRMPVLDGIQVTFAKIGARHRAEAVRSAYRKGLVSEA